MTDELRYLPTSSLGACSWPPWPACLPLASLNSPLCCSESEDSQRFELVFLFQQQPVCCSLFFHVSLMFDVLHTVLNSVYVHTQPQQCNSFFRGVMTPTLTPVRPGLHRQMLDFSECHCHYHCHCHCHSKGPSFSNLMNFQGKTGSQTPAARWKHMGPHSLGPSVW